LVKKLNEGWTGKHIISKNRKKSKRGGISKEHLPGLPIRGKNGMKSALKGEQETRMRVERRMSNQRILWGWVARRKGPMSVNEKKGKDGKGGLQGEIEPVENTRTQERGRL